ncbi:domain domain-containing protein [Cyclospora cayetanensis]|uniref:Domain domain-containing protein n=1 Tax=Cyclospora cayetanensis TaxID=88456 RepID=A0A1D3D784_9EIME|nr:domain domain-containing protein [Cyclospora cayetanensis]
MVTVRPSPPTLDSISTAGTTGGPQGAPQTFLREGGITFSFLPKLASNKTFDKAARLTVLLKARHIGCLLGPLPWAPRSIHGGENPGSRSLQETDASAAGEEWQLEAPDPACREHSDTLTTKQEVHEGSNVEPSDREEAPFRACNVITRMSTEKLQSEADNVEECKGAPQAIARELQDVAGARGPPEAPLSDVCDELQRSANLAMLVEGLLEYDLALRDCLDLRRWQRELDLTVPEVLSYLVLHDDDIDRAYAALVDDANWHSEIHKAKARLSPPRSSWISQIIPRFCVRASTAANSIGLGPPTGAAQGPEVYQGAWGNVVAPATGSPQRIGENNRGGLPVTVPAQLIGRPATAAGVSLVEGTLDPSIPEFFSTSLEGLRRRRRGVSGCTEAATLGASLGTLLQAPIGTAVDEVADHVDTQDQ